MQERGQSPPTNAATPAVQVGCQVLDWMAWAEGLESREAWLRWSAEETPPAPPATGASPPVPFVPVRMRRRLSVLNKMALYVAHHSLARPGVTPDRVILASRHGELHRTQGLLDAIAEEEPVSPAHFSLSVHNTSVGLFSIATGCKAPATALSAGADTLSMGLLEALGWLQNHPSDLILFIMADQRLPAAYQSIVSISEVTMTFATALLLTAAPPHAAATTPAGCRLTLTHQAADTADASPLAPQAFMRWLLSPHGPAVMQWRTQQHSQWQWSRHGHLA